MNIQDNNIEDITDILEFDTDILFTETHTMELLETIFHLIDEYITNNKEIEVELEDIQDDLRELLFIQFDDHLYEEEDEEFLEELIQYALEIYFTIHPLVTDSVTEEETQIIQIEKQIDILRNIIQPKQRTPEWYSFRNNLITASNAYKALDSESKKNQLIYEKCKPIKQDIPHIVNTDTSLHWGQKYEPLSVMIYEKKYDTIIEDFGCIRHSIYDFLGASPDGINIKESSPLYGRMLEIKNVVSRIITGIPKKEYWVQMQLQMEVCNLDKCDFLETKFIEYDTYKDFIQDELYTFTPEGDATNYKGIFLYFHNATTGFPVYIYKPLNEYNIEEWIDKTIQLYESEPYLYTFIRCVYWKLDTFHCMLIKRDRTWFQENIGKIEEVWRIIEKERISGWEHRAPKSRKPSDNPNQYLFVKKLNS